MKWSLESFTPSSSDTSDFTIASDIQKVRWWALQQLGILKHVLRVLYRTGIDIGT